MHESLHQYLASVGLCTFIGTNLVFFYNMLYKNILLTILGCTYNWTPFYGVNAPGLTQQGSANSYTQASCQQACINSPTCLSIDFNTQDVTCFFGTSANPQTVPNAPVNHFNLIRNCGNQPAFICFIFKCYSMIKALSSKLILTKVYVCVAE